MKEKMKRVVLLLLVLVIGAVGWHFWQQGSTGQTGKVEQEVVPHYSEVSGKIAELKVQLGQTVQAGDVLAVIDNSNQQYAVEQLEQVLVQKQAVVAQLLSGADQAAVQQARNGVQAAQATYDNARLQCDALQADLEKMNALYEAGGLSQQEYDRITQAVQTAQNNMAAAASQVNTAQQQVILLSKQADRNAVRAAQAAVAQTESQLAQAKEALNKYTIKANCSGTVISVNYTGGAMVSAGSDLVELADASRMYLLTYLPIEQAATVSYGQPVTVQLDKQTYQGEVCFIDVKAQYTPAEFQTAFQRDQESMKVKIKLPADTQLKPGQMAQLQFDIADGAEAENTETE